MERSPARGRFRKSAAARSAAALPPAALAAEPKESHAQHAAPKRVAAAPSPEARTYMFLSQTEVAFLDAAVARLIPKDELGPGAKEAGVSYFIDQQLFGGYGTMAKKYKQGPWPEGTPQQGYQSPLTPAEVYRAAIRDSNNYCRKQHGKTFDALSAAQQDEVLRGKGLGHGDETQVRRRRHGRRRPHRHDPRKGAGRHRPQSGGARARTLARHRSRLLHAGRPRRAEVRAPPRADARPVQGDAHLPQCDDGDPASEAPARP